MFVSIGRLAILRVRGRMWMSIIWRVREFVYCGDGAVVVVEVVRRVALAVLWRGDG